MLRVDDPGETPEGRIKRFISRITGDEFSLENLEDIFEQDPSKLFVVYIYKILDLISEQITNIRNKYSVDQVYSSLISAVLRRDDDFTKDIMQDHFEELLPGNEDYFKTTDFEDYYAADSTGMWERVLLFLGLHPKYSDILEKYFGDNGLISLFLLLQSLATGDVNFGIVLNALKDHNAPY